MSSPVRKYSLPTLLLAVLVAACTSNSTPPPPATASSAFPTSAVDFSPAAPPAASESAAPTASTTTAGGAVLENAVTRYLLRFNSNNLRAVLVSVDGRSVMERYTGAGPDRAWNVGAVTDSVVATLVGIAVDEGTLGGLDNTLAVMLPAFAPKMVPEVGRITLRQLLTMTAGFPESYEETFASGPGRVQTVDEILATKGLNTPGSFAYNNAAPHLLSAILAQATGQSVLDYARAKLFDPLGISTRPAAEPIAQPSNVAAYEAAAFAWPTDSDGLHLGSAFLKLTPADLLRLGQLYLDKGRWNGAQLVSSAWIADATAEHTTTDNFGPDGGYGFHWWRVEVDGEPAFVAAGLGGNLIEVVPGKSLVVVVATESHFDPATGGGSGDCCDPRAMVQMVSAAIVPNL